MILMGVVGLLARDSSADPCCIIGVSSSPVQTRATFRNFRQFFLREV